MSKVSDVTDAIIARCAAILTSHTRLPNPYDVAGNPDVMLKQGYGVRVGSAENSNRVLGNTVSIRRAYTIVLTRALYALDSNGSQRTTSEKTLLEDQWLMVADIVKDSSLNGAQVVSTYVGDTGVTQIGTHLVTEINILAEYFQQP